MDRLTSMRIFTRVVELGSYSAVASEQGISAQMVGKHVQGLEQWLGGKLFHKTTRQQALTELGLLFLARCERVLEELAEPAGRLRIAAPLSFGHHRLVPLLPAFLDSYPKLEVDLQLTPRWVDLVEEGFDAAIRTLRPQDEALIARPLLTQHYRLCAAPDYLNRHGVPVIRPISPTTSVCMATGGSTSVGSLSGRMVRAKRCGWPRACASTTGQRC